MKNIRTLRRAFTLLFTTLLLLAVFVMPANAFVTVGGDGIPTSNGFYDAAQYPLVGATISQAVGGLMRVSATSQCLIGSTATCQASTTSNINCPPTCTPEQGFSVRVISSNLTGGGDTCQGSDSYSDLTVPPTYCALDNGNLSSPQAGTSDSTDIQANGCASWTATWSQQNSHILYVDQQVASGNGIITTNVSFRLAGTIQLSNVNHTPTGDVWTLQGTLNGIGHDNNGSSWQATWSIPPSTVNTGVDCVNNHDKTNQATVVSLTGSASVARL
ncbi:MAG: hypothetical protein ACYDCC_10605 [Actinomycetota bacterium]